MEARSRSQHTAFHCAAREGHLKVVQFLLQQVRKDWGKYPGRTVGLWNSDWKVWCGGHTCFQILVLSCIWLSTYNNSGFHMFSLHITTLTYDLSYIKAMFQFTWVSLHRVFERLDPNWTSRPHIPSTSFLAFFAGLWRCQMGAPFWPSQMCHEWLTQPRSPGAPPSGHVDGAETDSAAFGICQAREGNRGKELWKCSGSIAAIA